MSTPQERERLVRLKREWLVRNAADMAMATSAAAEVGSNVEGSGDRVSGHIAGMRNEGLAARGSQGEGQRSGNDQEWGVVPPTVERNQVTNRTEQGGPGRSRQGSSSGKPREKKRATPKATGLWRNQAAAVQPERHKRQSRPRGRRTDFSGNVVTARPSRGVDTPEWRMGTPRAPAAPDNLVALTSVDRDLTHALNRHGNSGRYGGVRSAVRRVRVEEGSEWAFVDDGDVDDFEERVPEPVMRFSFELDAFQKRAIVHVEEGRSVFVAAHTSAGKTVVAEYAIALGAAMGGKVFYTSPIKTLSNQKLRDFRGKFKDVGLVTGDVSINENAQCVIMTTEILRSMLYRGADVIRDLSSVVFDEVQFLNDEERGVVWEESIIMLPPHVSIIMLSATVPNALEFAAWVGKTKDRRVAVVSTDKRPVPLQHSWLHPDRESPGGLSEALLLEQGGRFLAENYRAALKAGAKVKDGGKGKKMEKEGGGRKKSPLQKKREHAEVPSSNSGEKDEAKVVNGSGDEIGEESEVEAGKEAEAAVGTESGTELGKTKATEIGEETTSDVAGVSKEEGIAVNGHEISTISGVEPQINKGENRDSVTQKYTIPKGVNKNKGQGSKKVAASDGCGGRGPNSRPSVWAPLVSYLHEMKRTPSVIFCFSKKKCEKAVESLEHSDLLPDSNDKACVHSFFEQAILKLREEDRNLPQVLRVRTNLKRGISAHHAGLLPLIKEITEILFSKGLVKILFATETFALGVNMPARTVVFAAVRKHDGRRFRFLEAGEYTQMSGRAGRRGLDDVGHVYLFFPPDERYPEERDLCRIMTGKPISLQSAFRLTYNMILNVLRVDELRVEEMMKQSFSEAGEDTQALTLTSVLEKAGEKLSALNISYEPETLPLGIERERMSPMEVYVDKFCKLSETKLQLTYREMNPIFKVSVKPGTVVIAEVDSGLLSLAVVFSVVSSKPSPIASNARGADREGFVKSDSLLWVACIQGVLPLALRKLPASILFHRELTQNGQSKYADHMYPRIVSEHGLVVTLREVRASKILYATGSCDKVSSDRVLDQLNAARGWHFMRHRNEAKKALVLNAAYLDKVVAEWRKRLEKGMSSAESVPADYFCGKRAVNDSAADTAEATGSSRPPRQRKMASEVHPAYQAVVKCCIDIIGDADLGRGVQKDMRVDSIGSLNRLILEGMIRRKMATLKAASQTGSQPSLLPEYFKRVAVLQKLGYVGDDGLSVQLKGRCGCEVATADSVVLTEIVLENVLQGLEPAEVASLLSSLVCRKKNTGTERDEGGAKIYSEKYLKAKVAMRKVVEMVGKVQQACGVELEFDIADGGDDYEDAICRWDLAHAVYAWARGEPFFAITELTEQQEGDIVVCVKRLSELLRDAKAVAGGVGNEDLAEVLDEAVVAIRRDVVFNGSLYYDEGTTGMDEGS